MIALLALGACTPDEPSTCTDPPEHAIAVTTTDFAVGALALVDPADGTVDDTLVSTSGDAIVVADQGLWVLDRQTQDTVRRFTPGCWSEPELSFAVPRGANLHDLDLVGDHLFLTAYELNALLVHDLDGQPVDRISLSDWADADGLPEADGIVESGDHLFVALQNLQRAGATWTDGGGRVVRIDPVTRTVRDAWDTGPSPRIFEHPARPGSIVVLTGLYGSADGGLWILESTTDPPLREVLSEADADFDFTGYAELDGQGVLLGPGFSVGDPSAVWCVDWSTGHWSSGPTLEGWAVDAVADGENVWIALRSPPEAPGVGDGVVPFDPWACEVIDDPATSLLEPYSLAVWSMPTER